MIKKFANENITDSIELIPHLKSFDEHINLYKKIDLALDTFPYNGVTTSFEAIWMGVPVLTMAGYNFNSRCGESINKNLGLEQLIAKDENEYVSKAVDLSKSKEKYISLRKFIFKNAIKSPIKITRYKFSEGLIDDHINKEIPISDCIKKIHDFLWPIALVRSGIFNLSINGAQK